MKVGIYTADSSLPESGGGFTLQQTILRAIIDKIKMSNHEFVLIKSDSKNYSREDDPCDLEIISLYENTMISYMKKLFRRLRNGLARFLGLPKEAAFSHRDRILISNGVDLVISLSPLSPVFEIPYFITVWDLEHRTNPFFPEVSQLGIWDWREKHFERLLGRASLIFIGTQVGKSQVEKFYRITSERVKVIPFPSADLYSDDLTIGNDKEIIGKYGLPDCYLLYPAQFWPHKNHVGLLNALKILKDHYSIGLSVVFSGTDKGNLHFVQSKVIQLDLQGQVHFVGFVPYDDLLCLYNKALALTFVSLLGPDNIPPLEAFALGCPVIAGRTPGSEEQLGDNALLVNLSNQNELALAIKSVYEKRELRDDLINRGYERAKAFKPSDYADQIIKAIDEFEFFRECWGREYVLK